MNYLMIISNFILTHCYTIYLEYRNGALYPVKRLTGYKINHVNTNDELELTVSQWKWIESRINGLYTFRVVLLHKVLFDIYHTSPEELCYNFFEKKLKCDSNDEIF